MATTDTANQVVGRVIQVAGPAIDIQFPEGHIPVINTAVRVTSEGFDVPTPVDLIVEVAQHIGESRVRTIALQPRHAHAYIALGAFHAEVIDKVGTLIGGMTYGAKKDVGLGKLQLVRRALWSDTARITRKEAPRTMLANAGGGGDGSAALTIAFDVP